MFHFSKQSQERMVGLHPSLVVVLTHALVNNELDFVIVEGVRSFEKQREYVDNGKSWTMDSQHLFGLAVDIAPYELGKINWEWSLFVKLYGAVKRAALHHNIPIEWGGNWRVKDGPHFQLPRSYRSGIHNAHIRVSNN
jgi:peptidoglycan L-alanyl-D-glutamate endopeptidase CwlK